MSELAEAAPELDREISGGLRPGERRLQLFLVILSLSAIIGRDCQLFRRIEFYIPD